MKEADFYLIEDPMHGVVKTIKNEEKALDHVATAPERNVIPVKRLDEEDWLEMIDGNDFDEFLKKNRLKKIKDDKFGLDITKRELFDVLKSFNVIDESDITTRNTLSFKGLKKTVKTIYKLKQKKGWLKNG